MKTYVILFFLMVVGLTAEVYGQISKPGGPAIILHSSFQKAKTFPNGARFPYLPIRDTVIMCGEEIEVGAYFSRTDKDKYEEVIEVISFGRSKKSDIDKGYFVVKLKPQQTTRYNIRIKNCDENTPPDFNISGDCRIVYVAKTEEEKKQLQEHVDNLRKLRKEQAKKSFQKPVDVR